MKKIGSLESAFDVLEMYGVPKTRAHTVDNGIMVLVSRMEKEIASLRHQLEQLQNTSSNSEYAECPCCGEPWNIREHDSCSCGAFYKMSNGNIIVCGRNDMSWGRHTGQSYTPPCSSSNSDYAPCIMCRGCQHECKTGGNIAECNDYLPKPGA